MASILRVNTITDASSNNSTAVSTINKGSAKCVYSYLQASNTLENSTNVSSITDSSVGVFLCAYSNAFSSDTANSVVSACDTGAGDRFSTCVTRTASNHGGRGFIGTSATDLQHGFAVFGDLA